MFDIERTLRDFRACVCDLAFPWVSEARQGFEMSRAETLLAQAPTSNLCDFIPMDIMTLVMASERTGDDRFRENASERVQAILELDNWRLPHHQHMEQIELGTSMTAVRMSEVYLMTNGLSWKLREAIPGFVERKAMKPFYLQATDPRRHGWARVVSNWRAVICSEIGRAAFGFADALSDWRLYVEEGIKGCIAVEDAGGCDGGWEEGVGYWNYGIGQLVLFADALFQVSKGKVNLLSHPFLRKTGDFGLYCWMPGLKTVYGFSDWRCAEPRSDLMHLLAKHTGKGYYQWCSERSGYSLLPDGWSDSIPSCEPGALPPSKHFRGIDVALLRTGWGEHDTVVGFKCGPRRIVGHHHWDANSFVLFYGSQPIIDELEHNEKIDAKCTEDDCDLLLGRLGLEGEFPRDETATYVHNTALLGGKGQLRGQDEWGQAVPGHKSDVVQVLNTGEPVPSEQSARIVGFGSNEQISYAIGEAGPSYAEPVESFCRSVVLVSAERVLIADRFKTSSPTSVYALMHSPGSAESLGEGCTKLTFGALETLMEGMAVDSLGDCRTNVRLIDWELQDGRRQSVIVTETLAERPFLWLIFSLVMGENVTRQEQSFSLKSVEDNHLAIELSPGGRIVEIALDGSPPSVLSV